MRKQTSHERANLSTQAKTGRGMAHHCLLSMKGLTIVTMSGNGSSLSPLDVKYPVSFAFLSWVEPVKGL